MVKRSLHIGINDYPGTHQDLAGCVNDAMDWKKALNERGFHWQDVLLNEKAFKQAITDAIADIIVATEPGDIAVITYSGHGTWVVDENDDEADGCDEALCPHSGGILTDDELYELFKFTKVGAKVVFISDSCHSGTISRLGKPIVNDEWNFQKVKFLSPSHFLTPEQLFKAKKVEKTKPKSRSAAFCLTMSACSDTEYSYDAWFNERANGAFSYIALYCLKEMTSESTYRDWFKAIREWLPSVYYPQTPQLDCLNYQKDWKIF